MRDLHQLGCPILRLDIAQIGSSKLTHYTRWAEKRVKEVGNMPEGWLEELKSDADYISRYQLAWDSYITWPEELLPGPLREKYIRTDVDQLPKDAQGVDIGALELDDFGLWRLLLGLFRPISEFDPDAGLDLLTEIWQGREPLDALTSSLVFIERTRQGWSIETGGGLHHRTINIISLGAEESLSGLTHPDLIGHYFKLRNIDWIKNMILSTIEEPGEQIRLATTSVGIKEARRGVLRMLQDDAMEDTYKRAKERLPKSRRSDPVAVQQQMARTITKPEVAEMLAREVATHDIETNTATLPFYQSIAVTLTGQSREIADGLKDRVADTMDILGVRYQESDDPYEHWQNFLAMLPDVRFRETSEHVSPLPSGTTAVSFRRHGRPVLRKGALVGYYQPYRDPLIIPLGGNYFLVGTTGSGKSMAMKYMVYRLLPLDKNWVFRIMNNTNQNMKTTDEARDWNRVVSDYGGLVLFAGDEKFEGEVGAKAFRKRLEKIWDEGTRIVLFHSIKQRPDLDQIWLEWLIDDVVITPPGVIGVDETAGWFTLKQDPRAKILVFELMNILRRNRKMGIVTIQSLGTIRIEQEGVWNQLMTLIDGGKFVFHTPFISELPKDLGLTEYPEVGRFVMDTVASFKEEELGPLKKPGWAVFAGTKTAFEVKFHISLANLLRLSRLDMATAEEEELWGF
ncbi:MAG: hypothetical protein A3A65_02635 [Candidatus Chisholmbacteria bacterium RIFCSPLOWO2_01_FULL_49_14]|uniref:Uncharacterized protein n=1 Tax=Candidatus Chisholmbacteria bacterium RIFCSPLOWO2_01_FULL_49_14 TaxID=1797593 RepID=A0A1G1VZQ9_9BACT|nr:MAG: hypothetical protein A3A65_02635 [Candidatus Chisholmbacteria bacterium RIFCSPLOWO2_01_FULL_49_14]